MGGGNAGVVAVNAGHEYVVGTRGSDIVSSATIVLGMYLVHGIRGVTGVCEMGMCLARDVWEVSG